VQQLHEGDNVPLVLIGEDDQRLGRPRPVGIADEQKDLPAKAVRVGSIRLVRSGLDLMAFLLGAERHYSQREGRA